MAVRPFPTSRLAGYDWRAAAVVAVATLLPALAFVVLVREVLGWDFEAATRSPLGGDEPFGPRYGGWLGSTGVVGWTVAAAVGALAATLAARRGLLALVAVALAWAAAFARRLVADRDLPILVWAGLWYAVALLIDAFGQQVGWGGVREETAKLVGVASWLVFVWRTGVRAVESEGSGLPH